MTNDLKPNDPKPDKINKLSLLETLKSASIAQWEEMKADWSFFGVVGAFLAFFGNFFTQAQNHGIALDGHVISNLLLDFLSYRSVIIVLFALGVICAARNILQALNFRAATLASIANHSALRLRQISSAVAWVAFGFSAGLLVIVSFTFDAEALELSFTMAIIGATICIYSVAGTSIQIQPTEINDLSTSTIVLISALSYLTYVAFNGI